MIINDKHRFVFVHIPKCAGTTVRGPLTRFNGWQLAGPPWLKTHSELGRLDYTHIPLFVLREHFTIEFEAIQDYQSFAVVRDPFTRFASSVSQRLKMYSDTPIQKRSQYEIRSVIDECIDYLSHQPRDLHLLPPEYIHFQKQVDYIELDGTRTLKKLYTMNDIRELLTDVGRLVGQNLVKPSPEKGGETSMNRSVVFRNDFLRRVIETIRPTTKNLVNMLPESSKKRIRDRVYVARDQRMKDTFAANHVRTFVSEYYADDIAIYLEASAPNKSQTQ